MTLVQIKLTIIGLLVASLISGVLYYFYHSVELPAINFDVDMKIKAPNKSCILNPSQKSYLAVRQLITFPKNGWKKNYKTYIQRWTIELDDILIFLLPDRLVIGSYKKDFQPIYKVMKKEELEKIKKSLCMTMMQ
jgi:hypothetical protein